MIKFLPKLVFGFAFGLLLLSHVAGATIYTVTNTSASAATSGSLPWAVAQVNAGSGGDEIDFGITGTISLTSSLTLNKSTTIDGTTAPGYAGVPLVEITNGASVVHGLVLAVLATGCSIKGLSVTGFSTNGILVQSTGNTISLCYIGLTPAGTASPNVNGITISNTGNTIGGINEGNVISGNSAIGLNVSIAGNTVQGNILGMNAAGTVAIPNNFGLTVGNGPNAIGGTIAGAGNYISGNISNGLHVNGSNNTIEGNVIGLNITGTLAIPNGNNGIRLNPGANTNTIGGSVAGAGNTVSGNNSTGIMVGGTGNVIYGNIVGMNFAGTAAIPNNGGISLTSGPNAVGSSITGTGNFISGNTGNGLTLAGTGNTVEGNTIGLNVAGMAVVPNGNGIVLGGSGSHTVGGTASGARNIISGNTAIGITVNSTGNTIQGNIIGMNATGTAALGNGSYGLSVIAGTSTIGGSATGARNYISGNGNTGINIQSSATGTIVQGNTIGMNVAGTAAVPNVGQGMSLTAGSNTVGGSNAGEGNCISGNSGFGITINGTSTANTIRGNIIGLDPTGTAAIANTDYGIFVTAGSNTIGGSTTGAGNIISGNGNTGIIVQNSATGTIIQGNIIGMNVAGTAAIPNNPAGISLNSGTNTVGGTNAGEGNYISGHSSLGIIIQAASTANTIKGNVIGMNVAGTAAIPNNKGIVVNAGANIIGGSTTGAGNYISGNSNIGITLNSSGNEVKGNTIGLNVAGTAAIANGNGISITVTGTNSIIGGIAAGEGNVISGNTTAGIDARSTGNTIQRNIIGLNAAGTAAIANGNGGVNLLPGATNCLIGGVDAGNIISGNTGNGIVISDTLNTVQGNYIGTNASGSATIGNTMAGIYAIARSNIIGGSGTGQGNVISGNANDGVRLFSDGNTVKGNIIGMNASGTIAIPNINQGINVDGSNNTIGGATTGEGNFVSGNGFHGVNIAGNRANNSIKGNYVGTDKNGLTAIPNGFSGISVAGPNNTIGGSAPGERNLISGNTQDGININGLGNATIVKGNIIGLNAAGSAAVANNRNGIATTSNNNVIGGTAAGEGNIIAGNAANGITIDGTNNKVSGNAIYNNAGLGIDLGDNGVTMNDALDADSGPNGLLNFPVITYVSQSGGNTTVSGTYDGAASATFTLELFSNASADATGYGEGQTYIGSTVASTDVSGHSTFTTVIAGTHANISATATDVGNSTSEFSYMGLVFINADPQSITLCRDALTATDLKPLLHVSAPLAGSTLTWDQSITPLHGLLNFAAATAASGSTDIAPGGAITYAATAGYTGADAFTVQATDGTGTITMVVNVTVNPNEPIVGTDTVTFGLTIALSNDIAGGTWSTPTPWTTKVAAATGTVKGVSAGVSQISYSNTFGCVATHTVSVMSGTNACIGQNIVISDGLSGGTWTSSNASIASVVLTTGVIKGMSAGKATITHRTTTGIRTTTVTVNPLAATTATPSSVCQGQTLTMINSTYGGGTWYSGNTTTAAISGTGVVTGMGGGTAVIYYTPNTGCVTTKTITINAVTPITGVTPVCVSQTINVSNATPGGVWSSSSGSLIQVTATGQVKGIAAGTPRLSYIWTNGCQTAIPITVNALSQITGGTPGICQGRTMTVANSTPFGGVWSSSNTNVATISNNGIITGTGVGTTTVSFVTNVAGCVASRIVVTNACRESDETTSASTAVVAVEELRLYPNPNNGRFTLTGTLGSITDNEATIEVVNMLGQVIYKANVQVQNGSFNKQIELQGNLANGMYLLNMRTENSVKQFHFVVEQ